MFEQFFALGTGGAMEYLLPFFLMFAIVYGALDIAGVFESKKIIAIIAVVFGIFAASVESVRMILIAYMPYAAIAFVVFFFLGFLKKLFSGKEGKEGGQTDFLLLGIIAVLLLLTLVGFQGMLPSFGLFSMMDELIVVAGVLLIAFLFYAAYKKSGA